MAEEGSSTHRASGGTDPPVDVAALGEALRGMQTLLSWQASLISSALAALGEGDAPPREAPPDGPGAAGGG